MFKSVKIITKNVSNFGNFALREYCGLKCLFYLPEPAEPVEEKPSEGSVNRGNSIS